MLTRAEVRERLLGLAEELKALADALEVEAPPSRASRPTPTPTPSLPPGAESWVVPFGKTKGTPLCQLSAKDLASLRAWCVKTDPAKFGKLIEQLDTVAGVR